MRASSIIVALTLIIAIIGCGPKEEGTPLPTRTEKSSEGGFGGLDMQAQQRVPDKPLKYDPKHFSQVGLEPYPNPVDQSTAVTESYSSQTKTELKIQFRTMDDPSKISQFYTPYLNNGAVTPQSTEKTTILSGKSKTNSDITILITPNPEYSLVTIQATRVTQYEAK